MGNDELEDILNGNQKCIDIIRAMARQNDYSELSFILRLDIPRSTVESILNSANYTNDSCTLLLDSEENNCRFKYHRFHSSSEENPDYLTPRLYCRFGG